MYATISRYALCVLLPTVPGQYERDTAGNKKRFYYLFGLIVKAASSNEMTNGDHNMFDFSAALAMRKKGLQSEIEIESESVSVSATERQPQRRESDSGAKTHRKWLRMGGAARNKIQSPSSDESKGNELFTASNGAKN